MHGSVIVHAAEALLKNCHACIGVDCSFSNGDGGHQDVGSSEFWKPGQHLMPCSACSLLRVTQKALLWFTADNAKMLTQLGGVMCAQSQLMCAMLVHYSCSMCCLLI